MASIAPIARHLPLKWLSRDGWLIIVARSFNHFGRSSLGVLLAIYLDAIGFSLVQIGVFISVGLAGGAFFSFVVVLVGDTMGRRRLLVLFSLGMAVAALALTVTDVFVVLIVVAFFGSFIVGEGGQGGPVQPLETACIPETAPAHRRTDLFAAMAMMGTVASALGALSAGLPSLFEGLFGTGELTAMKVMFVGYAVIMGLQAFAFGLLSPVVEVVRSQSRRRWTNPFRLPSRRIIFSLTGVSVTDFFATSIVLHSLVALWFHTKFGMDLETIALLFFGTRFLSATSLWVGAKLADRVGAINAIVLTQIPPSLLLFVMPFLPYGWLAATVWLVRGFFSLMYMPVRVSYGMGVVPPEERSAMAGITSVTRSGVGSFSPTIASLLWDIFSAGAPFLAGGALKTVHMIGMYVVFRNVKPLEERDQGAEAQEAVTGESLPG